MAAEKAAPTVSECLATWIEGLRPDDIPEAARREAENTIIDTIGLSVAALETDYGQAVRKAFDQRGDCTVFGLDQGFESAAAAVINGTCGHGEDYDNTYEGCPVHSGVAIVPALFAAGETMKLPVREVAKGVVVGIEIACRLGLVAQKGVHSAGFHPTAILGCMGAAAGVAAAMGQDRAQIRDTLGVAGSMASGIIEYLADGTWTKRLHPGWAAQAGLRAAQLGAAGFRGPGTVFEGTHGLFSAFAPSIDPDFGPLTSELGERWETARVAFKPFACGTMTQPYVDCAVRLRRQGIRPEDIKSIVCEVGEGTVHRLWEPLADKQRPPTAYAAKFSSPYCVAAGLIHGDAGLAQFTEDAVRDPRALAVAGKVNYIVDPDNEYPANYTGHIRAELTDGRVVEERQGQLRGGTREPMSRDDLLAKARANLVFAGRPEGAADALADFATGLFAAEGGFSAAPLRRPGA